MTTPLLSEAPRPLPGGTTSACAPRRRGVGFAALLALPALGLAWLAPALVPEPLHADPGSDPTDVDADGIPNWQEHVLGTSQFLADSDGDGYCDPLELAFGTDPLSVASIPGAVGPGGFQVGLTARGEAGQVRLFLALYSATGSFQHAVLRLGALGNGQVVSVPFQRLMREATLRDVELAGGAVVRTIDVPFNPAFVHALGAATLFVAVGSHGSTSYHSAAKVDLHSVQQTVLLRRAPLAYTAQGPLQGGGTLRQPIPTTGPGSLPGGWVPGQICYQRSNVTGMVGAKVVHEIVSAQCLAGWDTFCPTDCSTSVGDTYETIDPATLIGG